VSQSSLFMVLDPIIKVKNRIADLRHLVLTPRPLPRKGKGEELPIAMVRFGCLVFK